MRNSTLPGILPSTIKSAIDVAIGLGIPFLWIDRYCVDQDRVEGKHDIIRNMDKIYQGAELTIIASVGETPQAGLPGLYGVSRRPQYTLSGKACTYVAADPVRQEMERPNGARGDVNNNPFPDISVNNVSLMSSTERVLSRDAAVSPSTGLRYLSDVLPVSCRASSGKP